MKSVWLMMLLVATTLELSSGLILKDTLPPLSSFFPDGNPCKDINCGNGTCVTTNEYPFVKCECKAGWKQPALHHEFPFQPCVIPNCTVDYNCSGNQEGHSMSPSAAPSPSHFKIPSNPFSPCSYDVCGGGSCVLKSNKTYEYECNCFQGYGNIFNRTSGFCARECELKTDCSRLGVSVSNDSYFPGENSCKGINCGNGTCVTTNEYPFVKCECKAGWKQPALHHEFPFQPCVIPNCTIDYNCSGSLEGHSMSPSMSPSAAPSPSHFKMPSNPLSPCSYSVCGGGSCVLKSNQTYEYECNCFQGYGNIFNWTWGFCAKECELKTDCSRLGVSVSNDSVTTNSSSSSSSSDAIGGLKSMMENRGLVAGSILATVMMLLMK